MSARALLLTSGLTNGEHGGSIVISMLALPRPAGGFDCACWSCTLFTIHPSGSRVGIDIWILAKPTVLMLFLFACCHCFLLRWPQMQINQVDSDALT